MLVPIRVILFRIFCLASSLKLQKCLWQGPFTIFSYRDRHTERVWVPGSILEVATYAGIARDVALAPASPGKSTQCVWFLVPLLSSHLLMLVHFSLLSVCRFPSFYRFLAVQNHLFSSHKHCPDSGF